MKEPMRTSKICVFVTSIKVSLHLCHDWWATDKAGTRDNWNSVFSVATSLKESAKDSP